MTAKKFDHAVFLRTIIFTNFIRLFRWIKILFSFSEKKKNKNKIIWCLFWRSAKWCMQTIFFYWALLAHYIIAATFNCMPHHFDFVYNWMCIFIFIFILLAKCQHSVMISRSRFGMTKNPMMNYLTTTRYSDSKYFPIQWKFKNTMNNNCNKCSRHSSNSMVSGNIFFNMWIWLSVFKFVTLIDFT